MQDVLIKFYTGKKSDNTLKIVPIEKAQWTVIPKDAISDNQLRLLESKLNMRSQTHREDTSKWYLSKNPMDYSLLDLLK